VKFDWSTTCALDTVPYGGMKEYCGRDSNIK
jgi:hypothetical protein